MGLGAKWEQETFSLLVFLIENCFKQWIALSPLLFHSTLDCAVRMVQKNYLGLDMNDTHQVLPSADDVLVHLTGDDIRTI